MKSLLAAGALALALSACTTSAPMGPSQASMEPECRQATPGNSLPGFRCTGDYTGDGSAMTTSRR